MNHSAHVKLVRPAQGQSFWAMTEKITFKLGPEDTDNKFSFNETLAQPGGGPPPHIHRHEDELFYVVKGEFAFMLGDKTFTRSKGFTACLPKGVVHTYNNIGTRPGKLLVLAVPCGFERFIRAWARPVLSPTQFPPVREQGDLDKLLAAASEFGIELRPDAKPAPDLSTPAPAPSFWVMGQHVTIKLTGADTAAQFSVAEVLCSPGQSVPNHIHVAMDELFYVLEGTAEFTFEDRVERVDSGGTIYVPRGAVHAFRNSTTKPVRLFDLHTPAGFEDFFREAGTPAADSTTPPDAPPFDDVEAFTALLRKHGMELREDSKPIPGLA